MNASTLSTGLGAAGLVLLAAQWAQDTVSLAVCLGLSGAAGACVLAGAGSSSAGSRGTSGPWRWASGKARRALGIQTTGQNA